MIKFLKLTERFVNGNEQPVLLNVACIKSVKLSEKGSYTHIYMTDGKYFFIKESVEQIWLLLNIDTGLAPVMTAEEALKYYKIRDGC